MKIRWDLEAADLVIQTGLTDASSTTIFSHLKVYTRGSGLIGVTASWTGLATTTVLTVKNL